MPPPPPAQLGPQGIPKPAIDQFNSSAPGGGAMTSGYNSAIQNLGNSLKLSQDTTSAGKMQLGQQLKNNQGQVQQNLVGQGLGNTTVANTMQQAPLQTYNLGLAQLNNMDATRGMQAYGNLANTEAQGGTNISDYAKSSAQQSYNMQMQQMMQQQQAQQMQQYMQQHPANNNLGTNLGFAADLGANKAAASGKADQFQLQPWMLNAQG